MSVRKTRVLKSFWEARMKKFLESRKEVCQTKWTGSRKSTQHCLPGSQWKCTVDELGNGHGIYTFPSGVVYEGELSDGLFNGEGELRYPNGVILRGKWNKGTLTNKTLIFNDGVTCDEINCNYCKMPDRRFAIEYEKELQPGGCSFLMAEQPSRTLPPGYYDAGVGFYHAKTNVIVKPEDLTFVISSPEIEERRWIVENCRSASDTVIGPREHFYEKWSKPIVALSPRASSLSLYVNTPNKDLIELPKSQNSL